MGDFIPLPRGFQVGGYTVEGMIGAGGFGAVYRARGAHADDVLALKVSHHAASKQTAQNLVRQQNEIEALMRLSHPALVRIFDYGMLEDQRLFVAMELVAGESLQEYLVRRGRLDPIEAIGIARRVAEALAHCHERNIFHLDLKSSNIMVADPFEPRIKVLDFGLAQLAIAAPRSEAVWAGSPVYMAPESFDAARAAPGPKIDLYALGTVFYEMVTASIPFEASDNWKLIAEKTQRDPIPVATRAPDLLPPLAALIDSLLLRDPQRRLGSALTLAARLKELYYDTLHDSGAAAPLGGERSGPLGVAALADGAQVPFAGRQRELERLMHKCETASRGGSAAVAIVGEAGLGKSRLAAELLTRASANRLGVVAYGRCRQLGDLVPYSPLREALAQLCQALALMPGKLGREARERVRAAPIHDAAVLVGLAPETAELLARDPTGHSVENVSSVLRLVGTERVARALSSMLAAVAQSMPVFVVIEDLHWADQGTLAVLARITALHPVPRSLVMVTTRPTPELAKIKGLEELPLQPLDAADSDDLMRRMTGAGADLIDALKRSIPLLGAGNPLVITHVVHNLEVEGYLARGADGRLTLGVRALDDYQPPSSVSAVLERTFEQLDAASRDVLGVGALIGRTFHMSDVVGLGLHDEEAVRAAVAAAARHHLCKRDGDRISFAHDTVREHLESTVAEARLPELHGRIAERLAARGIGAGPLGHHMERAGRLLPAAHAYFAAALEADRLHDPAGASHAAHRAIDALSRLGPSAERDDLTARAAFELSRVAGVLGDTGAILRELDRCAELIGEGRARHQVALAGAYARLYYVQGNAPKAAEHSQRCLSLSKDDPELASYQCLPINILGRTLAISGKFARGVEMLTRGCELAREGREYAELSHSYGILGVAHGFCGDADEALAAADQCTELAAALEDPLRILGAHLYRSAMSEALYDWSEGTRWSTGLLAFAEEHQIGGLYVYVGTLFAGRHQFHLGRVDRARVLLGNALNLSATLNIQMLASWAHAYLGDALFVAGRYDEAHGAYSRGLEMANAGSGDDYAGPMNAVGLAHCMAVCGGDDPARFAVGVRKLCDEALARLSRAGNVSARPVLLQRYAEALDALGDPGAGELGQKREAAARALPMTALDFWPRVPARADAPSPREYWRQFAAASSGNQRVLVDPSSDTQSDGSGRSSHLLEQLSTVVGFKPPF